jgi:hypothetical protein
MMASRSLFFAGVIAANIAGLSAQADSAHARALRSDAAITTELNKAQLRHPGVAAAKRLARKGKYHRAKSASRTSTKVDEAAGKKKSISAKEMAKAVPLLQVTHPPRTLRTAEIKNQAGEPVGNVRSVEIAKNGTARAVHADVGGFLGMAEKKVTIPAERLMYLKDRNLLVTGLSRAEFSRLGSDEH